MRDNHDIIDSHVHLDLIHHHHPKRIKWLKENNCGVVSWSYVGGVDSVKKLEIGLQAKAKCIRKLFEAGLNCCYLAGIHPRCIPPDLKPEKIASFLQTYMEDPLCRGIGEIGLETADTKEKEVLIAQLEFGRNLPALGKVVGVHTPRSNKPSITDVTLNILDRFSDISSSLVVDHCTVETIGAVLNNGFWAGVTLSPVKTSWDEVKRIVSVNSDKIDRIMCNTDSGSVFFEDVAQYSSTGDLPGTVRRKIFYSNAARFFTINE